MQNFLNEDALNLVFDCFYTQKKNLGKFHIEMIKDQWMIGFPRWLISLHSVFNFTDEKI